MILLIGLASLMGTWSMDGAVAADKADKKAKGPKAETTSRNLKEKLVDEEAALDNLTVAGQNSVPCETCDVDDPIIQDRVAVPLPGSVGSTMTYTAQEEARAAGARMPAMTNPYINFFQTVR